MAFGSKQLIYCNKKNIGKWIGMNAIGDNLQCESYWADSKDNLQRRLVEAKALIDRWDNVSTDYVFHPSKKDMIREWFKGMTSVKGLPDIEGCDMLWGARIHYRDNCPVDVGLCVALNPSGKGLQTGDSRSIAAFPMSDFKAKEPENERPAVCKDNPGFWQKQDGTWVRMKDMTDNHLENTIAMLKRKGWTEDKRPKLAELVAEQKSRSAMLLERTQQEAKQTTLKDTKLGDEVLVYLTKAFRMGSSKKDAGHSIGATVIAVHKNGYRYLGWKYGEVYPSYEAVMMTVINPNNGDDWTWVDNRLDYAYYYAYYYAYGPNEECEIIHHAHDKLPGVSTADLPGKVVEIPSLTPMNATSQNNIIKDSVVSLCSAIETRLDEMSQLVLEDYKHGTVNPNMNRLLIEYVNVLMPILEKAAYMTGIPPEPEMIKNLGAVAKEDELPVKYRGRADEEVIRLMIKEGKTSTQLIDEMIKEGCTFDLHTPPKESVADDQDKETSAAGTIALMGAATLLGGILGGMCYNTSSVRVSGSGDMAEEMLTTAAEMTASK